MSEVSSAATWVRFLRNYGPIPTNDNMYAAIAHITVCTFEDVVLPQMVIMSFSPREALLFFEHVEVHVVAHVALRCLLQRLEFPWVVGAVA